MISFSSHFNNLIHERYLKYNIPSDESGFSKEKMLYDFYVLSYLDQFCMDDVVGDKKGNFGEIIQRPTLRRELSIDLKDSFSDAKKTLLHHLKKEMLDAVLFSVSAEFRHIYDYNSDSQLLKFFGDMGQSDFFKKYTIQYKGRGGNLKSYLDNPNKDRYRKKYKSDNREYYDSFISVKNSGIDSITFIKIAKECFSNLSWKSMYGGMAWAQICSGYIRLYNSQKENELFVAIDHVYDLQHNTDTVFNKLESYRKDNKYDWIKKSLEHKKHVAEPHELLPKCSGTIKSIALAVLKSEGFDSWEGFSKKLETKSTNSNQTVPVTHDAPISTPTAYGGSTLSQIIDNLNTYIEVSHKDSSSQKNTIRFNEEEYDSLNIIRQIHEELLPKIFYKILDKTDIKYKINSDGAKGLVEYYDSNAVSKDSPLVTIRPFKLAHVIRRIRNILYDATTKDPTYSTGKIYSPYTFKRTILQLMRDKIDQEIGIGSIVSHIKNIILQNKKQLSDITVPKNNRFLKKFLNTYYPEAFKNVKLPNEEITMHNFITRLKKKVLYTAFSVITVIAAENHGIFAMTALALHNSLSNFYKNEDYDKAASLLLRLSKDVTDVKILNFLKAAHNALSDQNKIMEFFNDEYVKDVCKDKYISTNIGFFILKEIIMDLNDDEDGLI